jgi:hypothetical protein
MGGLLADNRRNQGYTLLRQVEAALPMPVWAVDLEIERLRDVSAAELAVLRLIDSGVSDVPRLAQVLGMGSDHRLAESVLVKLLAAGAADREGDGFRLTTTGLAWKAEGNALARERVTFEVRLDPVHDSLEWMNHERPIYATEATWTIELPPVDDEVLIRRKPELGNLVREQGLPDDVERAPGDRRAPVDLRAFSVVSRRLHWRRVRLDFWAHPVQQAQHVIAYIADSENPPLTKLIERHVIHESRRRLVPPG